MKQIDWDVIADNIFVLVLTSPIWIITVIGIYAIVRMIFGS